MTSESKTITGRELAHPRSRRNRSAPQALGTCWDVISIAAAKLDLEPQALRARCRRASRAGEKGELVARLGMGVIACKLGKSWRVHVPSPEEAADAV
jgi:transposase InsO family protein